MTSVMPKTVRLEPLADTVFFAELPEEDDTEEQRRLASEVRALPDIVTDEKKFMETRRKPAMVQDKPTELSVSTRIERRRRERHDATLQELNLALEQIQEQMALQVRHVAEDCRQKIEDMTTSVNDLLQKMGTEEVLNVQTVSMLDDVEVQLGRLFDQRKAAIADMMTALKRVEAERLECIAVTMREHGKALVSIAFQLRPDVERTLFQKSQQLNLWLLENKSATAVLQARLLTYEVNFYESVRHKLEVQRAAWLQVQQAKALKELQAELNVIPAVDDVVIAAREKGEADSAPIRRELLEVFSTASRDLMPNDLDDTGLSARVEGWRSRATTLVQSWDELHGRMLGVLELDMDDALAELDRHSSRCQVELVRLGACDSARVPALVEPIVSAERKKRAEVTSILLAQLKNTAARGSAAVAGASSSFFEEASAVAALWDELCETCAKKLAAYRETIDRAHEKVEADREKDENDVKVYVDELRHAQSGDDLENKFDKLKRRLDAISDAHAAHQAESKQLSSAYKNDASAAIAKWRAALSEHFKVQSSQPTANDEQNVEGAAKPLAGDYEFMTVRMIQAQEEYRSLWLASFDSRVLALETDLDHFVEAEHVGVDAMVEMHRAIHEGRVQGIEDSIVNVRKAELLHHRNRIARHCRGLDKELEKENERFSTVQEEIKTRSAKFVKLMEDMIARLVTMENVTLLQALQERCATTAENFRVEIRKWLQRYRQSVDDALGGIREANGVLRSSFKTFSEGGNFSSFEIMTYTQVLVALESRIDEAETMIVEVLNTMEGEQAIVAENMMQNCDDRVKILLRDVKLYETAHERIRSMQVEFKSHIGECNAQSAALDAQMATLRDLEPGTPVEQIFDSMRKLVSLVEERAQFLGALKLTSAEAERQAAAEAEAEGLMTSPTPKTTEKAQAKAKKGAKRKTIYVPKTMPTLQPWSVENRGTFMVAINELRNRYRTSIVDDLVAPYYDSLHGKTPIRADLVPESAQVFIDSIETSMNTIFDRVVQFHRQCLTEFVDQVTKALKSLKRLMPRPFESAAGTSLTEIESNETAQAAALAGPFKAWQDNNAALLKELRPALGHPKNADALAQLSSKETQHCEALTKLLDDQRSAALKLIESMGPAVLQQMYDFRGILFEICQGLVHEDDIGIHVSTKKSLKAMLKDRVLGDVATAHEKRAAEASIRVLPPETSWKAVEGGPPLPATQAPDSVANRAINSVYEKHASAFAGRVEECMTRNEAKQAKLRDIIKRTHEEWLVSVQKVRAPYIEEQ